MEERLRAIRAAVDGGRGDQDKVPAFHIASPMEGFCRVCDVDKCVGNGESDCKDWGAVDR